MALINADPRVMEFFPAVASRGRTAAFIGRMDRQFCEKGFCYFAADKLESHQFIGFIGLSQQSFDAPFNPCIDIGWRLAFEERGSGFATERSRRCLRFTIDDLWIREVYSMAPKPNVRSET